jgi:fluoroquinolone resistance protein
VGDADLSEQSLATVECVDTTLVRLRLSGATLRRWSLEQCRFVDCDLSNALLGDSLFDDVTFEGCRLLGLDWSAARAAPFSAKFERCSLRLGRLSERDWRGTSFEACDLREADFTGADLRKVDLRGCDLSGALFDECDLRGADLRGATGLDFDPAANRIRGARVDGEFATRVAQRLGFLVD